MSQVASSPRDELTRICRRRSLWGLLDPTSRALARRLNAKWGSFKGGARAPQNSRCSALRLMKAQRFNEFRRLICRSCEVEVLGCKVQGPATLEVSGNRVVS